MRSVTMAAMMPEDPQHSAGARAALAEPGRRAALGLGEDATVILLSTERGQS